MFWARGDVLSPLFNAGLTLDDFPEESGQTDGTLAHCLERLLGLCPSVQGMRPGIIKDTSNPSWSPWRLDQYLNLPSYSLLDNIQSPKIRLIAFDIFDTLLCRPVLDPETIKAFVARRMGEERGRQYLKYRAIAEQQSREAKRQRCGVGGYLPPVEENLRPGKNRSEIKFGNWKRR